MHLLQLLMSLQALKTVKDAYSTSLISSKYNHSLNLVLKS